RQPARPLAYPLPALPIARRQPYAGRCVEAGRYPAGAVGARSELARRRTVENDGFDQGRADRHLADLRFRSAGSVPAARGCLPGRHVAPISRAGAVGRAAASSAVHLPGGDAADGRADLLFLRVRTVAAGGGTDGVLLPVGFEGL